MTLLTNDGLVEMVNNPEEYSCQGQLKIVQKWQFENVQLWQFKMALYDQSPISIYMTCLQF